MASMEDVMAGLFGGNAAPGAEDELRRRGRAGGVAGASSLFSQFLPYIQGIGTYDYSGAPGASGLARLLGPAARHAQRQGERVGLPPGLTGRDQLPPGLDTRNPVGGPNVAPGNLENYQSNYNPGLHLGQAPHSQGWLNVAPGYAVAAGQGYGTPAYGAPGHAQRGLVAPAGGTTKPGGGGPAGHKSQGSAGGGPSGGNRPSSAPSGGGNPGASTSGSAGGGRVAPDRPARGGRVARNRPARGGTGTSNQIAGRIRSRRQVAKRGGRVKGGGRGSNPPNHGHNNTPSETRPPSGWSGPNPHPPNHGNNNTPSETRPPTTTTAPSASHFGTHAQGGTAPIKTKPKPRPASQLQHQRI